MSAPATAAIPLGVVVTRKPGVTRWARHVWTATAVLPGAPPAHWRLLRENGTVADFHAATPTLELYRTDTEAYRTGISDAVPAVYVVLRAVPDPGAPFEVVLVTVSPFEAQDYADTGEEIVEKVPMPEGLVAWVRDFVEAYHEEETFVKRKRDRVRTDRVQDGIGDARIRQVADVYRAPQSRRPS